MSSKSIYDVKVGDFTLSPELAKRAKDVMNRVWQEIAPDALNICAESEEEYNSLDREDVLELVYDADRMAGKGDDEAARYAVWVKWFAPHDYDAFVKMVFPCDTYGW